MNWQYIRLIKRIVVVVVRLNYMWATVIVGNNLSVGRAMPAQIIEADKRLKEMRDEILDEFLNGK